MIDTIRWSEDGVEILDQTLLPQVIQYRTCRDFNEVADAIRTMKIRGAPAIGIAAAMGAALGAQGIKSGEKDIFYKEFERQCQILLETRPTAINLAWAINKMREIAYRSGHSSVPEIKRALREESQRILDEDILVNRSIGNYGKTLIKSGQTILTHCNAGALATGGYGTAIGIIRAAWEEGKGIKVFVDETRPLLQGARLTIWELAQEGIPSVLITDSMAGECMRRGLVDVVVVGADRITVKGDVANKIGTYTLAALAHVHNLPFYVAAPLSTIDFHCEGIEGIPIEERPPEEVTCINGKRIAPSGIQVFNPAFDVTPAALVGAIVTEKGIVYPPYERQWGQVLNYKVF